LLHPSCRLIEPKQNSISNSQSPPPETQNFASRIYVLTTAKSLTNTISRTSDKEKKGKETTLFVIKTSYLFNSAVPVNPFHLQILSSFPPSFHHSFPATACPVLFMIITIHTSLSCSSRSQLTNYAVAIRYLRHCRFAVPPADLNTVSRVFSDQDQFQ
jgi:hypothetical protein